MKDLYLWAGNPEMVDLCEVEGRQLVGLGIEKIIHPRSLEQVISCVKRKALGDTGNPTECCIYIKNQHADGTRIRCAVFLLKEPQGAFLIMAVPECKTPSVNWPPPRKTLARSASNEAGIEKRAETVCRSAKVAGRS